MRQRERRRAWVRVAGIEFCRRQTGVESCLAVPAGREEGGEAARHLRRSLDGQARSRLVGRCSCAANQGGHLRQTRGVESCIDFIGSVFQKRRQKLKHLIESTGAWPPPGPSNSNATL